MYDENTRKQTEKHQAAKAKKNANAKRLKALAKAQPGNIVRTRLVIKGKAAVARATSKRGGKPVTNRHGSLATVGRKLANKGKQAIGRATAKRKK